MQFIPVETDEQIQLLAGIAGDIWHECFVDIISKAQIDYMVDMFQSYPAIREQIKSKNYVYYLFKPEDDFAGYMGIVKEQEKLFLSKLYLKSSFRGRKLASEAFDFIEQMCRQEGFHAIWLTVNRMNGRAIQVYRQKGFQIVQTQVANIGGGFVMDDYIMEKSV